MPQFWVEKIESPEPVIVTGRCWFGPVAVGMILDQVACRAGDGWHVTEQCRLLVEEIGFYGGIIDQLDQMCSARLVLHGSRPASLRPGSLLMASSVPGATHWDLEPDGLWHLRPAAAVGPWRSFSLRVLQASWGIAVDIRARAVFSLALPPDSRPVSDRVALDVHAVRLGAEDLEYLSYGLALMAPAIQRAHADGIVLVEVCEVTFTPTDYQPEGLTAAIIGWSAEEFGVDQAPWELRFEQQANRYRLSI
jgi:hypothetical protein